MARPAWGRLSVLLALVVAVSAGCGAEEPPPGPFPPRPQDIAVDRLDPCQGITAAKASELGTRGAARSTDEEDAPAAKIQGARTRSCSWSNLSDYTSYSVSFIDREVTNGHGAAIGNGTIDQVAGYGVVRQEDDGANACRISVDAGHDRTFRVDVLSRGDVVGQPVSMTDVCRSAADVTSHVIETLRALS
ncbi:DUF3558 family protein [Pseudonocardia sp. HH130630-07]|uniref:DUF3558 family protein n=1 Tax=Pseudonocardia sp. HH130630-07 TaxID=1690815 RepID=UPI000814EE44|nr:DUF3558 family protein [Pseudonocardia sp. HH130630-07]ANY05509.1 hypothetical protein AFB00_03435 [Pseudonocardia sp. HH130630-07]